MTKKAQKYGVFRNSKVYHIVTQEFAVGKSFVLCEVATHAQHCGDKLYEASDLPSKFRLCKKCQKRGAVEPPGDVDFQDSDAPADEFVHQNTVRTSRSKRKEEKVQLKALMAERKKNSVW